MRGMFLTPGEPLPLLALSAVLIIPAIWAVLSSPVIYSREMTWDLMFNLDGAWRLYNGQTAHVDFHDPLGTLPFAATALGFYVVGTKPFAFLIGETIVAILITVLAVVAVKNRLALVPAALFVTLCALLTLVPLVIGDLPTEYTFAMAYNRFGWSLLGILYVIIFVGPRNGRRPVLTDVIAAAIIVVALYYVKITYFGVAFAGVGVALMTSRHVRQHYRAWCVVLALIALIALAPFNHGYIADIVDAMSAGSVRTQVSLFLRNFAYGSAEQSSVIAADLVLFYLWLQGRVSLGTLIAGAFVFVSGLFLISQNAQEQGIPLYVIPTLLILVAVCDWARAARSDQSRHAIALIGAASRRSKPLRYSSWRTPICKGSQYRVIATMSSTNSPRTTIPPPYSAVCVRSGCDMNSRNTSISRQSSNWSSSCARTVPPLPPSWSSTKSIRCHSPWALARLVGAIYGGRRRSHGDRPRRRSATRIMSRSHAFPPAGSWSSRH